MHSSVSSFPGCRSTGVLGLKAVFFLGIAAIAASVLVARGPAFTRPDAAGSSRPVIAAQSVAEHCTKAIPQVWESAKESGQDLGCGSGNVLFAAFNHVATNYCLCAQSRFGDNRSDMENEFYGQMAGFNLRLKFSHTFTRKLRVELDQELASVARKNRHLLKSGHVWLKDMQNDFRLCVKEQRLARSLSAFGSN